MKNEKLEIKREVWEYFREYRKAPYRERYEQILNLKQKNKISANRN
jgi:hypothetical protein